jgi:hypothetical protein
VRRFPFLRTIPAWIIGIGFRPEHVKTTEAAMHVDRPGPEKASMPGATQAPTVGST